MITLTLCLIIAAIIGLVSKKTYILPISLFMSFLIGLFINATIETTVPRNEITYRTETASISPIEENLYVISDESNYVIRQNGKLTAISRSKTQITKGDSLTIKYIIKEMNYKQPWRAIIAPVNDPKVETESIIIEVPKIN